MQGKTSHRQCKGNGRVIVRHSSAPIYTFVDENKCCDHTKCHFSGVQIVGRNAVIRTSRYNFCRAQVASSYRVCQLAAISAQFVARCRRGFEHVRILMQLGDFWEITADVAPESHRKSPLVSTCEKSTIGERDKNRMCKRAFGLAYDNSIEYG